MTEKWPIKNDRSSSSVATQRGLGSFYTNMQISAHSRNPKERGLSLLFNILWTKHTALLLHRFEISYTNLPHLKIHESPCMNDS